MSQKNKKARYICMSFVAWKMEVPGCLLVASILILGDILRWILVTSWSDFWSIWRWLCRHLEVIFLFSSGGEFGVTLLASEGDFEDISRWFCRHLDVHLEVTLLASWGDIWRVTLVVFRAGNLKVTLCLLRWI